MNPLRFIVIGCGHMGRRHVEKVLSLGQVEPAISLVGVADVDIEAARSAVAGHHIRATGDARNRALRTKIRLMLSQQLYRAILLAVTAVSKKM